MDWSGMAGDRRCLSASRAFAFCVLALTALTTMPASAIGADAPAPFWKRCENGSAGGQCSLPRGVATDPNTGYVYLVDQGNHRIQKFTAWGDFVRTWGWGVASEGGTCAWFERNSRRLSLEASLERGCQTFVTGNAATRCRLDFVQAEKRMFRELADEAGVALVNATHYGMEKPPQLAMAEWFRKRGIDAEFRPGAPE